jgi:hypothetical protein
LQYTKPDGDVSLSATYHYVASVRLGTPPSTLKLLVDTSSSELTVRAGRYNSGASSTFVDVPADAPPVPWRLVHDERVVQANCSSAYSSDAFSVQHNIVAVRDVNSCFTSLSGVQQSSFSSYCNGACPCTVSPSSSFNFRLLSTDLFFRAAVAHKPGTSGTPPVARATSASAYPLSKYHAVDGVLGLAYAPTVGDGAQAADVLPPASFLSYVRKSFLPETADSMIVSFHLNGAANQCEGGGQSDKPCKSLFYPYASHPSQMLLGGIDENYRGKLIWSAPIETYYASKVTTPATASSDQAFVTKPVPGADAGDAPFPLPSFNVYDLTFCGRNLFDDARINYARSALVPTSTTTTTTTSSTTTSSTTSSAPIVEGMRAIVDTSASCLSLPRRYFDIVRESVPVRCEEYKLDLPIHDCYPGMSNDEVAAATVTTIRRTTTMATRVVTTELEYKCRETFGQCSMLPNDIVSPFMTESLPTLSYRLSPHGQWLYLALGSLVTHEPIGSTTNGRPFCLKQSSTDISIVMEKRVRTREGERDTTLVSEELQRRIDTPQYLKDTIIFGSLALQSFYTVIAYDAQQVALANKVANHTLDTQCKKVETLRCKGMQTRNDAYNVCIDPVCSEFYFFSLNADEHVCELSPAFHILITVLVSAFLIVEVGLNEIGRALSARVYKSIPNV